MLQGLFFSSEHILRGCSNNGVCTKSKGLQLTVYC